MSLGGGAWLVAAASGVNPVPRSVRPSVPSGSGCGRSRWQVGDRRSAAAGGLRRKCGLLRVASGSLLLRAGVIRAPTRCRRGVAGRAHDGPARSARRRRAVTAVAGGLRAFAVMLVVEAGELGILLAGCGGPADQGSGAQQRGHRLCRRWPLRSLPAGLARTRRGPAGVGAELLAVTHRLPRCSRWCGDATYITCVGWLLSRRHRPFLTVFFGRAVAAHSGQPGPDALSGPSRLAAPAGCHRAVRASGRGAPLSLSLFCSLPFSSSLVCVLPLSCPGPSLFLPSLSFFAPIVFISHLFPFFYAGEECASVRLPRICTRVDVSPLPRR